MFIAFFTRFYHLFFASGVIIFPIAILVAIPLTWCCRHLLPRFPFFIWFPMVFLSFYLGILPLLELALVLAGGFLLGRWLFKLRSSLLALFTGSQLFFLTYLLLIFISNSPAFARQFVLVLAAVVFVTLARRFLLFRRFSSRSFIAVFASFNFLDWALLMTVFVLGTLPQQHWDAVQANLYIAKWYLGLNSFHFLPEAISSLFPQTGNLYYTWFLAHSFQFLSLGIFLPFLGVLLLLKKLFRLYSLSVPAKLVFYSALFLPIFIFQGSNGYYDLLVLFELLLSFTLILGPENFAAAALVLGLAASLKYFPLVLLPLPFLLWWRQGHFRFRNLGGISFLLLLSLSPLLFNLIRTYQATGSPIFPFFQQLFPTPGFWSVTDHLEQNSMIVTTLDSAQWLKGGFLSYPYLSFLHSSRFIESTPYYVGAIYALMLPFMLFALPLAFLPRFRHRLSSLPWVNLAAWVAYLFIGILTRYYRYLWPFQFLWLTTSVFILQQLFPLRPRAQHFLGVIFILGLAVNWYSLVGYYRLYPVNPHLLFHPDYYLTNKDDSQALTFLNARLRGQDLVLDSSTYLLPRFNFNSRVYQCDWYWINGPQLISPSSVNQFRFLITDIPPNPDNYCTAAVVENLDRGRYRQIYQDNYYAIYEQN